MTYKPCKLGQTGLVFWILVCDQSSSVRACMQDYKSMLVAATICATLVNTQAHRHTPTDRETA